MQAMIGVSLAVHMLIFLHIAGIYRSQALTYIELTLNDISKPVARAIPRPRSRNEAPKATHVQERQLSRTSMPIKIPDNADTGPSSLMADISAPAVPLSGGGFDGAPVFATINDYLEMVRMKIESRKQYPDTARKKHQEGRVTVQFVITTDGQVSSVTIAKGSRYEELNAAGLAAVRDAAPFPYPPRHLFDKPLQLDVTLMFQLT